MQRATGRSLAIPRNRLWAEFLALFVAIPLMMLLLFGLYPLFGALLAMTALALVLLARTPGFSMRELVSGPVLSHWPLILVFTVGALAVAFTVALVMVPERAFAMPRRQPELWLRIMLFYPLLSALPQEVIFRALFFRRYGELFPDRRVALAVNAGVFSLAHLFYQNPVAIGLTFLGGVIFALAYQRTGSFPLAVILHAIGGQALFTAGLGIYFYHGAIGHAP